ncbi:MAG: TolC family protein [Vicinamibacterales bacterium]
MKPALQFLASLLFATTAAAQSVAQNRGPLEATPLSLEDALTIAEAKSEQVAIARAGVTRADGEKKRARSERFPQLVLLASYDRTLASEFSGLFDESGDATGDEEGSSFEDLPFGRKNIWRIGLTFSQALYTGGRVAALEATADAGRSVAEIAVASARAQLALDVIRAYYDAALSDRLVTIAESALTQADAAYQQTTLAYQAGTQPEFEQLRAQVERDNQQPIVIRRTSERDLAYLRLKQLLELPASATLQLTAALDGLTLAPPERFATVVALAEEAAEKNQPEMPVRAPVRQAESAIRISDAAVNLARAARLPSVSVNSSYGKVNYPGGFFPDVNEFRTNWTIGVGVQVPILTGGRLKADQAIAVADKQVTDLRLKQTRELVELDTRAAYEELRSARASWEASAGTVTQAARAYQIAEVRYRQGISTQLELSDSRLALELAAANRAMAGRDLQVSRARVALLPDLPLGARGGSPQITAPPVPVAPPARLPQAPGTRVVVGNGSS